MYAGFKRIGEVLQKNDQNYDWLFCQVVDAELSMYDEIMISTMSTPCFKVSFSIHEPKRNSFDIHPDSFACIWQELKKYPNELINIEVSLYDSTGTRLARGLIYEYDEKRDQRVVELRCRSDIGVYLDGETEINDETDVVRFSYAGSNNVETNITRFTNACMTWFNTLWVRAFKERDIYLSQAEIRTFFKPIVDEMLTVLSRLARADYLLSIRTVGWSVATRRYLLPQLAQMLNAKFIYIEPHFEVKPFTLYSENSIDIQGYISNEKWDSAKQTVDGVKFIESIKLFNTNRQEVGDITKTAINNIHSRLAELIKYRSYSIWGFAHKIIYPGNTISLNETKYYVQDIKYEPETLNTKKTFNATCVRFV